MSQDAFMNKHQAIRLGAHRRITQDGLLAINPKAVRAAAQLMVGPIDGWTGFHIHFPRFFWVCYNYDWLNARDQLLTRRSPPDGLWIELWKDTLRDCVFARI